MASADFDTCSTKPDAVKVSTQNADYQIEYTIKIFSLETHGVAEGYACVLHGAPAKVTGARTINQVLHTFPRILSDIVSPVHWLSDIRNSMV